MTSRWPVRRALTAAGLAVVVCAYCGWVSLTTPFTTAADVAVGCGFVGLAVIATRALWRRYHGGDQLLAAQTPRLRHWWPPALLVVGLECLTYVLGQSDRSRWPTISSLYDSAATSHAAKAAFVLLWVLLGLALFRR